MADMVDATETAFGTGGGVRLRLFAALHVATVAGEQLAEHAERIAAGDPTLRPVTINDIHMTFSWLGDVAEEHVPAIANSLDAAADAIPGATGCCVAEVATLGNTNVHAAVIDVELLTAVDAARDAFIEAVAPYAPEVDRRAWYPHITLVRTIGHAPLPQRLLEDPPLPPAATWVARELTLHASLPAPVGRQYRLMHATLLGNQAPAQY